MISENSGNSDAEVDSGSTKVPRKKNIRMCGIILKDLEIGNSLNV